MNTNQITFNAKSHIQLLAAAIFITIGLLQLWAMGSDNSRPNAFAFLFLLAGTPLLALIHSSLVAVTTYGPSIPRKLGFIALSAVAQIGAFVVFILGFRLLGDSTFIPVVIASVAGCLMYLGVMSLVLRLPIVGRTIGLGCGLSSVWAIGLLFPEPGWVFSIEPFVWWIGVSTSLALTLPKSA